MQSTNFSRRRQRSSSPDCFDNEPVSLFVTDGEGREVYEIEITPEYVGTFGPLLVGWSRDGPFYKKLSYGEGYSGPALQEQGAMEEDEEDEKKFA